jgi:hypothetical protein
MLSRNQFAWSAALRQAVVGFPEQEKFRSSNDYFLACLVTSAVASAEIMGRITGFACSPLAFLEVLTGPRPLRYPSS